MKKKFLLLPTIIMNMSGNSNDGDDFDNSKSQGFTPPASYSGSSSNGAQSILSEVDITKPAASVSHDAPPSAASTNQVDIEGLWYLLSLNGKVTTDDLIFYKITPSNINVLPYGKEYAKYQSYTYTMQNNVVDFGNGPFNIVLDKKTLILTAIEYDFQIVFTSVVQHTIHTIVTEKLNPTQTEEEQIVPPTELDAKIEDSDDEITKISDSDMVGLFSRFKWKAYAYIYGNSSISYNQKDAQFVFKNDSSFILQNSYGLHVGSYEISGSSLSLTYADGFPEIHKSVFMEYNKSHGYHFLFISEDSDKYEGSYTVYISMPEE